MDSYLTWGTANGAYGAHFSVVTGAIAGDEIAVTVTGTSITDAGTRTAADSEEITIPNATAADSYFETSKKWLGQVAVETTGGTAISCDYGWTKYWDAANSDFTVAGMEALWNAIKTGNLNIELMHHKATGWTYTGSGPTPPTAIKSMQTIYNTEYSTVAGEEGAFKITPVGTSVAGSGSEGILVRVTTASQGQLDSGQINISVLK